MSTMYTYEGSFRIDPVLNYAQIKRIYALAATVIAKHAPRHLRHMASDLWAADAIDHAIALAQAATSGFPSRPYLPPRRPSCWLRPPGRRCDSGPYGQTPRSAGVDLFLYWLFA